MGARCCGDGDALGVRGGQDAGDVWVEAVGLAGAVGDG